ncbi:hypothetical protein RyT2_00650 [Pseudolactococcus yaeyamensis]
MTINYNRGNLFSRVATVLFLGSILFVLLFFALPLLDTLGEDGIGIVLPVICLILVVILAIGLSLRLLAYPFAVKLEQETLTFSGQVLKAIKLDELDFLAYDETFQDGNSFQILLGFSEALAKTFPEKAQKKLLETKAGQKLLVLNFSVLEDKSWDEFWKILSEKSLYVDSILLDKQGLLENYKKQIATRKVQKQKILAFISIVIAIQFILQLFGVDRLIQFDIFH